MASSSPPAERFTVRLLAAADATVNRLASSRLNPLYQSGTVVVALLITLLATGLWLILFYRVGAPWASVAGITADPWVGNWVRGLHRYASDAAVVATLIHAARMFAQGRNWGPRALAWVTGVALLLVVFVCGWTGYVMVWDTFGQLLAREGARMFDTLPVLSEPTARAFAGEHPMPAAFFFLNLFAHSALPLGLAVGLWLHLSRVARPSLLPPKPLLWTTVGVLTALALVRPLAMSPEASPFRLPETVRADWFFAFWIPVTRSMGGGTAFAGATLAVALLVAVPAFTRRRGAARPVPSVVDEKICTGCRQCSLDCPWEAIAMQPRADGRVGEVAHVDPERCVSCGICAGSCAPMGVGPPGRTGRDQLARVRAFLDDDARRSGEVVAICCERGAARFGGAIEREGATVYPVDCAGNLHTSVVEALSRGGMGGVLILACPERDCWNREGPRWLIERLYHDREAELQPRVDRRRVRVAYAGAGERWRSVDAVRTFCTDVHALGPAAPPSGVAIDPACDPPAAVEVR